MNTAIIWPDNIHLGKPPRELRQHPHLVIPYYPGDNGVSGAGNKRAFPSGVISYQCAAIKVNGKLYNGAALERNTPLDITVDVSNLFGNLSVWAQVTLYWADPAAVFSPANMRISFLGDPVMVYVPAGRRVTSPVITFTPDVTVPDHVCLIAEVTAAQDRTPHTMDIMDRHYGQYNLILLPVTHIRQMNVRFFVSNPFLKAGYAYVKVRAADDEELRPLQQLYQANGVAASHDQLQLRVVKEKEEPRFMPVLELHMDAGTQQLCEVSINTGDTKPGTFSALIIEQYVREEGEAEERYGSLGMVWLAEG